MKCPVCDGPMWDNREKKRNPKAPDFKCRNKTCDGVIWPPKEGEHQPVRNASREAKAAMRGNNHSMLDERQRAIIRQHSQSMALEVLKLKVTLNELTVEDVTPLKLKSLADYFDEDVLGATMRH